MTLGFKAAYHQVAPNRVICSARLTRWSVPIATLVSAYQRQDNASRAVAP